MLCLYLDLPDTVLSFASFIEIASFLLRYN